MKRLLVVAMLLLGCGVSHATQTENPEQSDLVTQQTLSDPGTIAGSAVAYYGPVRSFGARAIVFYVTTTDADSMAAPTIESSDDDLKYYAVNTTFEKVAVFNVTSKNINGRVSRIVVTPTDPVTSGANIDILTSKWIKLKLTALGNDVSGVSVRTIIVKDADAYDPVYTWTLP